MPVAYSSFLHIIPTMATYVVLSPHFDDGVLSCGGRIAMHRRRGDAVRVLTLFAAGARGAVPPFAAVQHEKWGNPPDANRLRRAEDVAAYARLGCYDVYHLDAPDAVYRLSATGQPLYGTEQAIFGAVHEEEASYDLALLELVRPYIPANAMVLAPWGMGNHVDHQLTYRVGRGLESEGWDVGYYEEVPYVDKINRAEWQAPTQADYRLEALPLTESDFEAKVEAMTYYRTQIPVLYGSEEAMRHRLRATAQLGSDDPTLLREWVWWQSPQALLAPQRTKDEADI